MALDASLRNFRLFSFREIALGRRSENPRLFQLSFFSLFIDMDTKDADNKKQKKASCYF